MKKVKLMDEDKLREKAITLLMRELGPVETVRFLAMLPLKRLNAGALYCVRQDRWVSADFFNQVFVEKDWNCQTKAPQRKRKNAISSALSARPH